MLPHLLEEVNGAPALADALARQMGAALVAGLTARPEAGRTGNGDRSGHPFRGKQWGKGGQGTRHEPRGRARGQDQFGHLADEHGNIAPEKNIARGHRVIGFLRRPGHKVECAMSRKDVGVVGMEYRDPDHGTGWGNSHIESKHGRAALLKVPEIIHHGTLHPT